MMPKLRVANILKLSFNVVFFPGKRFRMNNDCFVIYMLQKFQFQLKEALLA